MENLIEFECVAFLNNESAQKEKQKYEELGIDIPEEDTSNIDERIVKYCFDPTHIVEAKQTFIRYKGEWVDAVIAMYLMNGKLPNETPFLLTTYKEFKERIDEHNKKSFKIGQGRLL